MKLLHISERVSFVFCDTFQKYPLLLYCSDHCGVTFLGIFTRIYADCKNVIFSHLPTILPPTPFGLTISNKTAKIMRASANLNPMT